MVESSIRKSRYKLLVLLLKATPMVLAFCNALNTILWLFDIDAWILSYISGISLFPTVFIYLSSYVFEFCEYHRMFMHYIVVSNVLSIVDYYTPINVSIRVQFILICVSLFLILYLHQTETKHDKDYKKSSSETYR